MKKHHVPCFLCNTPLCHWNKKIRTSTDVNVRILCGYKPLVDEDGFGPSKLKSNRFTVCPLWPLGNSSKLVLLSGNLSITRPQIGRFPKGKWSWWTDSNPRPADYKSAALPTELHQQDHWSGRQDLNLRHLGPKPSTLPN